jgi:hypothetical protein
MSLVGFGIPYKGCVMLCGYVMKSPQGAEFNAEAP